MNANTAESLNKSDQLHLKQLNEMLRLKEAAQLLGFSLVTLWRLGETDPTFPKKIRITSRCVGYRLGDLLAWQESRQGSAA